MSKIRKQSHKRNFQYANKHASIQTRPNTAAMIGGETFTANREDSLEARIFTDSSNTTRFAVQVGKVSYTFSGREARTLQRLLNKHYLACGSVEVQPGF